MQTRAAVGVAAFLLALPVTAGDVGTNLDGVEDFSPQYVFVDAFKQSRDWLTQSELVFDTGEEAFLDLDSDGWVRSLPAAGSGRQFDRVASLLFFTGENARYPAGQYLVTYDGEGVLEYRFDAVKNGALSGPGRDVLAVTPNSGFAIVIRSTNPGNHLRNIRVWMPGFDATTGPAQFFHPDFLSLIERFSTLRFMDWMRTNASDQVSFGDRPRPGDVRYTFAGKGVPIEVMVDLANRVDADPWFNMPHRADDGYVTQFATLVRDRLEPGRKVYVEYSNEVWNDAFPQGSFIESQGEANFPGPDSGFTKRMNQHGRRTAEICDLWEGVFAAQASRVVCVLGAQAPNTFTATAALDCPLWIAGAPCAGHHIDAVAIAPYFGGYLGAPSTASFVGALTLDQLFTEINAGGVVPGGPPGGAIAETESWVTSYRGVTDARDLALVAYEGGQHLVGFFGAENDSALAAKLVAVNRDSRIGAAYTRYLEESWAAGGGELFMHFTSCFAPSKFGSWGAVERLDQQSTPKQNALLAFLGAGSGPCVPDANTLCLSSGRFRVTATWRNAQASGAARAFDIGLADTGLFTFLGANNVELLVKVLNGCGINSRYWVFISAATNQEWHVTVEDIESGTDKVYDSPLNTFPPLNADTSAFATCP